MATLNLKDPVIYAMTADLAEAWGTTKTGAVRRALAEAQTNTQAMTEARVTHVEALLRSLQPYLIPDATRESIDTDLYDDMGLPR